MAVTSGRRPKERPPLDGKALERFALRYVERYATSRAKLAAYLFRKIRERGWAGHGDPPIQPLVQRFSELGYVDDRAFAMSRALSFGRRGYGARRLNLALKVAGIDGEDAVPARETAEQGAWAAALRFAERRRIGPYAAEAHDPARREKAFAAMVRAGHPMAVARRIVDLPPGVVPEEDDR